MTEKVFDGGLMPGAAVSLGIDQSLTGFGMSAVDIAHPNQHETWVFSSKKRGIQRLVNIRDWILDKFIFLQGNGHTVHDIAMEAPVMLSPSTLKLAELAGIVRLTLFEAFSTDLPGTPLIIPPTTLKKFVTGKGNAQKQEMLLQVYKRWGVEFSDDNAADAYSLGRLASGRFETKAEEDFIRKVLDGDYRDL